MANDFSSDSSIYAWWRFEPGALTTDSKGSNTLTPTASNPTSETSEYMEGSGCVRFDMRQSQYYSITDANLPTGFPLKSTDATKTMTASCWLKLDSYNNTSTDQYIMGKWSTTASRQCWLLYLRSGNLFFGWKYNATTGGYYPDTGIAIDPGRWYWVGVRLDGVNRWLRIYVFDLETKVMSHYIYAPGTALYMGAADFIIGSLEGYVTNTWHGLIDEVVISSNAAYSWADLQAIRLQKYSGVIQGNLTYTNDFSGDNSIKAHYRFESGALTTDSKGSNTLTASTSSPTESTATHGYREGTCSAAFLDTSTQYFYRLDKDLPDGFPLKTGDIKKQISVCFWMRPTVMPGSGDYNTLFAKYDAANNNRTFIIDLYYNRLRVLYGYGSGASAYTYEYAYTLFTAGNWFHVSVALDGLGRTIHCRIWDEYNQKIIADTTTINIANELSIGSAPITIGALPNAWPTVANLYYGLIDDVVVFDRVISLGEMDALRQGKFSNIHQAVQATRAGVQIAYRSNEDRGIRCVRPEKGCDSFSGLSWDQAWHNWVKPLPSNEVVLVERNDETTQSGTATATNNSRSVTTTNDLSAAIPQYSIIRFGSDDAMYMVRAITTNTISLYRPYRGTTGSGKTVKAITPNRTQPGDVYCWTLDANPGQTIDVRCGIDMSTNLVDGFTVWDLGNLGNAWSATGAENCKLSRAGFSNANSIGTFSGCHNFELEKVYFFRGQSTGADLEFTGGCSHLMATELIYECHVYGSDYSCLYLGSISDSTFIDCECWPANTGAGGVHFGNAKNITFIRFHQGHGKWGVRPSNTSKVEFIDSELGEETENTSSDIYIYVADGSFVDLAFRNSKLNSTNLFAGYSTSYWGTGEVAFERFNQVDGDHRVYHLTGVLTPNQTTTDGYYRAITKSDYTTFKTIAPSVKVEMYGDFCRFPVKQSFLVPCDANTPKTISVYFRKNSEYGGEAYNSKLPYMTLRYPTSASVFSVDTVTMPDTTNTWSIVSKEVTPGLTCAIEVDLYFWSRNSGAIAWYDEFEAS